mmetsp:Transcript_4525/g.9126  ORF Transcript_4525/g.9126 Transcript_4525/m.9126 type:complete len:814 (+) Transcript_4525:171-2612(+)|eukprot:CAMPEP_0118657586 /NCGR_PEP_ID=MMETSP0785-20121206/14101_1 /TAXON_ID=91992 /ORGANISM="Bolidomonas pacifica, Strain CCMP 1866" /LENGTH=813 /DNA_ID=CAMNT_0006550521 /DNA_START=124 /DNA_END=2565 /DNA_ORIENTATION=+
MLSSQSTVTLKGEILSNDETHEPGIRRRSSIADITAELSPSPALTKKKDLKGAMEKRLTRNNTNKDLRDFAEEELDKEGIMASGMTRGAAVKWKKLKIMVHKVYKDLDFEYKSADDLVNFYYSPDDETAVEDRQTHLDMKVTKSLLGVGVLKDQEMEAAEDKEEDDEKEQERLNERIALLGVTDKDILAEVPGEDLPDENAFAARISEKPKLLVKKDLKEDHDQVEFRKYFDDDVKNTNELLAKGDIIDVVAAGDDVAIERQVHMDHYTDYSIKQRFDVMKNPTFRALAKNLYDMLKDDQAGHITKKTYQHFCLRINLVMIPKDKLDLELAAQQANSDWDADVKDESSGYLSWKSFYLSIFQLVDIWTVCTSNLDREYIMLLTRIMEELTMTKDGKVGFLAEEACHFNAFFNFLGDIDIKAFDDRQALLGIKANEEDQEHSLEKDLSGKKIDKKEKRHSLLTREASISNLIVEKKVKKKVLSPGDTVKIIGNIFAAKVSADAYCSKSDAAGPNSKDGNKIDRFDVFVMRYFQSLHGTKKAARRYMRIFCRSVRHNANEHPRVEFFRRMAGIPNLEHDPEEFIPCLFNRYFLPCLRRTFLNTAGEPLNGAQVKALYNESGMVVESSYGSLIRAVKPLFNGVGPFKEGVLSSFGKRVKEEFTIDLDKNRFKGTWVDFDKTMLHATPVFVFGHRMMGFTRLRAIRTIQSWVRRGMPALERYEPEGVDELAGFVARSRDKLEMAKQLDEEISKVQKEAQNEIITVKKEVEDIKGEVESLKEEIGVVREEVDKVRKEMSEGFEKILKAVGESKEQVRA